MGKCNNMKKLDLHIHTVSTIRDKPFSFSIESLKDYVENDNIDAIAITNHNVFDKKQFEQIRSELTIPVFPGIEVDIEGGHLLVISDEQSIDDFCNKCAQIQRFNGGSDKAFVEEETFISVFHDLSNYLLIPHYDKEPRLDLERIPRIRAYITCGEVSSAKKFLYLSSCDGSLVPVWFSDWRAEEKAICKTGRQTYFDIDEITLTSIKYALTDSAKVSLKPEDGNVLFQILDNGLQISTGLTVILGKRSSGKTYTLDLINEQYPGGKYIRQFSLLSKDDEQSQRNFEKALKTRGSSVSESFLGPFKTVVDDVQSIDLIQDEKEIEDYLSTLKKAANEAARQDVFSKAILYQETPFGIKNLSSLERLIEAVDLLLNNLEYKELVEKHITRNQLSELAVDLRRQYIQEKTEVMQRQYVNSLVNSIKKELSVRSTATSVSSIDFYNILMNRYKVRSFVKVVKLMHKQRVIESRNLYSYNVVAKCKPFSSAMDLQRVSRSKMTFSDAFRCYSNPYAFLQILKEKEIPSSDYYKYFVQVTYEVLNQYGCAASGGERSEYNLLQELSDGAKNSILILDEPESSFDNIFLKDGVDSLLKEISKSIPVVIATHNNTIGISVHPDYLIYACKEIQADGKIKYHLYSGYPSNSELIDLEGNSISCKSVLLDCLEAGEEAYMDRRTSYEILNS